MKKINWKKIEWECRGCHEIEIKYPTICSNCSETRGFIRWMIGEHFIWSILIMGCLLIPFFSLLKSILK